MHIFLFAPPRVENIKYKIQKPCIALSTTLINIADTNVFIAISIQEKEGRGREEEGRIVDLGRERKITIYTNSSWENVGGEEDASEAGGALKAAFTPESDDRRLLLAPKGAHARA